MFQFGRFPTHTYVFSVRSVILHHGGFPIRKSTDIMLICSSPWLIAACHVLLRLLMPRHSPCALISLNFQCSPLAWVSQFFVCLVIFLLMKRLFLPPFVLNCFLPHRLERPIFFLNCFLISVRLLYSVFNEHKLAILSYRYRSGWTRTIDLALIRRAL